MSRPVVSSLWIGDLDQQIDEATLRGYFIHCPEYPYMVGFRLIRDRDRRRNPYAFIDFSSSEAATSALIRLKNQFIPGLQRRYRLKQSKEKDEQAVFHEVYVKDIAHGVGIEDITGIFGKYPSFKSAKMMTKDDAPVCLASFDDPNDAKRAITETGRFILNHPILVTPAILAFEEENLPPVSANMQLPDGHGGDECTIKIDNVADNTHREALENHFLICGPIKSIQIFAAQHQAYVEFFYKVSALTALPLNGTMILGAPVRVTLKKPPVGTKADLRKLPLMLPIADVLEKATRNACMEVGIDSKTTGVLVETARTQLGGTPAGWLVRDYEFASLLNRKLLQSTDEYKAMVELRRILNTDPNLGANKDILDDLSITEGPFKQLF